MSDYRPEEVRGWPKSWYVGEDVMRNLRCPVSGCRRVFISAEEVRSLLNHAVEEDQNGDMEFRHKILMEMVNVTKCPKCERPYEFTIDNIPDVRELFQHELDAHGSEELSDVNKFIVLIREHRDKKFGGGPEIWSELHEYHKRQIRKQPRFTEFEQYVQTNYPLYRGPPPLQDSHLKQLSKNDRLAKAHEYKDEDVKQWEWCYPVKSDEFLGSLHAYKPIPADPEHILNVFKKAYTEGKF